MQFWSNNCCQMLDLSWIVHLSSVLCCTKNTVRKCEAVVPQNGSHLWQNYCLVQNFFHTRNQMAGYQCIKIFDRPWWFFMERCSNRWLPYISRYVVEYLHRHIEWQGWTRKENEREKEAKKRTTWVFFKPVFTSNCVAPLQQQKARSPTANTPGYINRERGILCGWPEHRKHTSQRASSLPRWWKINLFLWRVFYECFWVSVFFTAL